MHIVHPLLILLGWFQPELLSVTDASFAEKLVQGLMMTIVITSWHLPQLLSEMLFVRQIIVLDHHFEHLTTHIKCCFEHKHMYDGGHTDSYEDSRCCLDHSVSMLKLFKLVEKTFCKQLSMLVGDDSGNSRREGQKFFACSSQYSWCRWCLPFTSPSPS